MNVRAGDTVLSCCARMHADHENEKTTLRLQLAAARARIARLEERLAAVLGERAESAVDVR